MKQDIMTEIINDENVVLAIIDTLRNSFKDVLIKYVPTSNHNALSFYLTGHCPSFAKILYEIFEGNCTILDDGAHVITKIGDKYYDIRGFASNYEDISKYNECPIEYFPMIEMFLGKTDDCDEKIMQDLISIGKDEINKIKERILSERTI